MLDGVHVARAFELQDGSIVYQESGGDIRRISADGTIDDTPLVTNDSAGSVVLDDADACRPGSCGWCTTRPPRIHRHRSTSSSGSSRANRGTRCRREVSVWGTGGSRSSTSTRWSLPRSTTPASASSFKVTFRNGIAESGAGPYDAPLVLAADGAGSVAWLAGDGRVSTTGVRDGLIAILDAPADVRVMDYRTDWLGMSRIDGSMQVIDTVNGIEYDVPVERGDVTISREVRTVDAARAHHRPDDRAGADNLPRAPLLCADRDRRAQWCVGVLSTGEVQWTTEPMAFAVRAPDGSMLMQRKSGGYPGAGWSQADTLPLRQASPSAPLEDLFGTLLPAGDVVPGWYTLHDTAMVGERSLVILDRQADLVNIESPAGALLELDLGAGSLVQIGQVGGWETGLSRLHLAETGIIVGERYDEAVRSFYSVRLDGTQGLSAADLGLETNYLDCTDCPRLYTISRDGSILAWLDGTHLERRRLVGENVLPLPPVELDAVTDGPLEASDLSVNVVMAAYDRNFVGAQSTPVLVYLDAAAPRVEIAPAARTALP